VPKPNIIHNDVPVALADDEGSQRILVGVVVDGSFVPFGALAPYAVDEAVADEENEVESGSKSRSKST
jgi:hypothetical protein